MAGSAPHRVDPRRLLRVAADGPFATRVASNGRPTPRDRLRGAMIGALALAGLGAFGAVVVRAHDDAGVLAFLRDQARPMATRRAEPAASAPRAAMPGWWRSEARRAGERVAARAKPAASQAMAYAPAEGRIIRTDLKLQRTPQARAAASSVPPLPPTARRGQAVAYCVRSCDGYFFPLSPGTGTEAGDAAACRSLCPAAETRVYARRIGDEMELSRNREGRPYARLATAFRHRATFDAACSCTGQGLGLATDRPVSQDATLRLGDAVMTPAGMKVFAGGRLPHREASFTPLRRSQHLDEPTRDALRRIEAASLPGRSGIALRVAAPTPEPAAAPRLAAVSVSDATAAFRVLNPMALR